MDTVSDLFSARSNPHYSGAGPRTRNLELIRLHSCRLSYGAPSLSAGRRIRARAIALREHAKKPLLKSLRLSASRDGHGSSSPDTVASSRNVKL